jgi:hypothetical protein
MKLVADESVDRNIVWLLRQEGHDVVYIAELDPGISDDIVLSIASESGALLVRERGSELQNNFSVVSPGWIRIRHNP